MKIVSIITGRPIPQPRSTQKVAFLFAHPIEYWEKVDKDNSVKAGLGMVNKKGKPYKATRYAYRLARLQKINDWRAKVHAELFKATDGHIPTEGLFFFYLIKVSKSWTKKKKKAMAWNPHLTKPDTDNLHKGVLDTLYRNDSAIHTIIAHKMYVPEDYFEGLVVLQDKKFVRDMIQEIINEFIKPKE